MESWQHRAILDYVADTFVTMAESTGLGLGEGDDACLWIGIMIGVVSTIFTQVRTVLVDVLESRSLRLSATYHIPVHRSVSPSSSSSLRSMLAK